MKRISNVKAGMLAAMVAGTLALGATPVLAIHASNGSASVQATKGDCTSCHSLRKSREFTPEGWDLLHHMTARH